jgi:hypothetical protein
VSAAAWGRGTIKERKMTLEPLRRVGRFTGMHISFPARVRNAAVAVAVAGVGLAAIGGAAAQAAPAPGASASVNQCFTRQLSGSLKDGSGAAGSTYYNLTLKNISKHTCKIGGFAGVSYRNAKGQEVGAAATREGSAHGFVTLQPGQSAKAQFREVDPLDWPASTCHLEKTTGLRVYPPNQRVRLVIKQKGEACSNTSLTQLTIEAF